MLAIRTKSLSQLSILNQKKERVIVNIPIREWVVLEFEDSSRIINFDKVISDGEVFNGLWNLAPASISTNVVFYLKSSGDNFTVSKTAENFEFIKSVSKSARLETISSIDNIPGESIRNGLMSESVEFYSKSLITLSNRFIFLKKQLQDGVINKDRFQSMTDEIYNSFLRSIGTNSREYFDSVFFVNKNSEDADDKGDKG